MVNGKRLWTLFTPIAPEILVGKYLAEWFSARLSKKRWGYLPGRTMWNGLSHGFYANMSGFVAQSSPNTPLPERVTGQMNVRLTGDKALQTSWESIRERNNEKPLHSIAPPPPPPSFQPVRSCQSLGSAGKRGLESQKAPTKELCSLPSSSQGRYRISMSLSRFYQRERL